ncbi:MAG: hypothetical protein NTY87_05800 [Planctomycetia bacterium]|nr:hypothetical protein [Planctomycetia bacterium]
MDQFVSTATATDEDVIARGREILRAEAAAIDRQEAGRRPRAGLRVAHAQHAAAVLAASKPFLAPGRGDAR